MRNSSYLSKRISDSVLGLVLVVTPLSFLVRPIGQGARAPVEEPSAVQTSSLGKFLESEISNRIERVSGQPLSPEVRSLRSREIASAIAEASYLHSVDPFLLLSMIEVESRYQADAVGLHGELGLMQIKPSTARWVTPVTDEFYGCDLHQVRCNVMMGATYVSHLQHRIAKQRNTKDEVLRESLATPPFFREHVLRSYNFGPARANRLAKEGLATERLPANEIQVTSYATKVATRTDRMKQRYLKAVLVSAEKKPRRAPESTSTVAMIQ